MKEQIRKEKARREEILEAKRGFRTDEEKEKLNQIKENKRRES